MDFKKVFLEMHGRQLKKKKKGRKERKKKK